MALPDWATEKIGPLPAGVWLLAIAGGLGLAYFINRGGADDRPTDDPTADPTFAGLPPTEGAVRLPGGGGGSDDFEPPGACTDNACWRRRAFNHLLAVGIGSFAASAALGRFLAGLPLDTDQRRIIDLALGAHGEPPEGAPVAMVTPPPDDPAPPAPTPPIRVRPIPIRPPDPVPPPRPVRPPTRQPPPVPIAPPGPPTNGDDQRARDRAGDLRDRLRDRRRQLPDLPPERRRLFLPDPINLDPVDRDDVIGRIIDPSPFTTGGVTG